MSMSMSPKKKEEDDDDASTTSCSSSSDDDDSSTSSGTSEECSSDEDDEYGEDSASSIVDGRREGTANCVGSSGSASGPAGQVPSRHLDDEKGGGEDEKKRDGVEPSTSTSSSSSALLLAAAEFVDRQQQQGRGGEGNNEGGAAEIEKSNGDPQRAADAPVAVGVASNRTVPISKNDDDVSSVSSKIPGRIEPEKKSAAVAPAERTAAGTPTFPAALDGNEASPPLPSFPTGPDHAAALPGEERGHGDGDGDVGRGEDAADLDDAGPAPDAKDRGDDEGDDGGGGHRRTNPGSARDPPPPPPPPPRPNIREDDRRGDSSSAPPPPRPAASLRDDVEDGRGSGVCDHSDDGGGDFGQGFPRDYDSESSDSGSDSSEPRVGRAAVAGGSADVRNGGDRPMLTPRPPPSVIDISSDSSEDEESDDDDGALMGKRGDRRAVERRARGGGSGEASSPFDVTGEDESAPPPRGARDVSRRPPLIPAVNPYAARQRRGGVPSGESSPRDDGPSTKHPTGGNGGNGASSARGAVAVSADHSEESSRFFSTNGRGGSRCGARTGHEHPGAPGAAAAPAAKHAPVSAARPGAASPVTTGTPTAAPVKNPYKRTTQQHPKPQPREDCRGKQPRQAAFSEGSQPQQNQQLHHGGSLQRKEETAGKESMRPQNSRDQQPSDTAKPTEAASGGGTEPPPQQGETQEEERRRRLLRRIASSALPPSDRVRPPDARLVAFTERNRPPSSRRSVPVEAAFGNDHAMARPLCNLWRDKYRSFNHVQSEMVPVLCHSDDSVVVSAPTGAGKTCLFEMAMVRLFAGALSSRGADGGRGGQYRHNGHRSVVPKDRKIVYIAPSKALCEERHADWSDRLSRLDLDVRCAVVTGDSAEGRDSYGDIRDASVILTTPEKWDGVTRKWTDHMFLLGSVKLLLLDEVHMLGDAGRGGCLEAVICRMKTVARVASSQSREILSVDEEAARLASTSGVCPDALASAMRIVAVSATLPNIVDIASFLEAPAAFAFDASYRPVPLTTHVLGFGWVRKDNQFLFDRGLNRHVPDVLARYGGTSRSGGAKPAIVFCHTKKETEALANELSSSRGGCDANLQRALNDAASRVTVGGLQKCLRKGVAYHHAGLEAVDRQIVEQTFMTGAIRCLCATSTLAMGVNLPAHLVVVKGTVAWRGSGQGHQDIDSGTLLQMMGRAGRPGFDTSGTAVIMTDNKSRPRYESLSGGMQVVESQLLHKLVETLNIEISQRVITDASQAILWVKSTFFFTRVRKHPHYYGMQGKSEQEMNSYLMNQCMKSIQDLDEAGIISINEDGLGVTPLVASHVMSQHLVSFCAMKQFMALRHDSGPQQILEVIAQCEGLQRPVRRSEKKVLNDAHKLVKYKLEGPLSKVRVQAPTQKAFVLLQAAIGQHYLEDFTLRQEMSFMVEHANRMLMAVQDYSVKGTKHGQVALESLLLRRSLASSLWGPGDGVLNQLRGVGAKTTKRLAENGIATFLDVIANSSHSIEQAAGRKRPFGQEIREVVAKILRNTLSLSAFMDENRVTGEKTIVCRVIKCSLDAIPNLSSMPKLPNQDGTEESSDGVVSYTLTVHTDRAGGSLIFRRGIRLDTTHRVPCPERFGRITVRLVSNLVGLDNYLTIEGNEPLETSLFVGSPKAPSQSDKTESTAKGKASKAKVISTHAKRRAVLVEKKQNMGNGINDVRLQKSSSKSASIRSPKPSSLTNTVTPSPTTASVAPCASTNNRDAKRLKPDAGRDGHQESSQMWNMHNSGVGMSSNRSWGEENYKQQHRNRSLNSGPSRGRSSGGSKSWHDQKRKQQMLQQGAFGSPKQNPFSAFKFDPNNAESNLDALSKKSHEMKKADSSETCILPRSSMLSGRTHRRPGFASSLRTPASGGLAQAIVGSKRKRNLARSHRMADQDLLRLKANEQEAYATALSMPDPSPFRGDAKLSQSTVSAYASTGNHTFRNIQRVPVHTTLPVRNENIHQVVFPEIGMSGISSSAGPMQQQGSFILPRESREMGYNLSTPCGMQQFSATGEEGYPLQPAIHSADFPFHDENDRVNDTAENFNYLAFGGHGANGVPSYSHEFRVEGCNSWDQSSQFPDQPELAHEPMQSAHEFQFLPSGQHTSDQGFFAGNSQVSLQQASVEHSSVDNQRHHIQIGNAYQQLESCPSPSAVEQPSTFAPERSINENVPKLDQSSESMLEDAFF